MNDKPADKTTQEPAAHASALAALLIRNFNTADLKHGLRAPLYDAMSARLAPGTAAVKLGCSIDIVAPGQRSCPYHLHHAQEEMFIVLEGSGTLRVAGEMLPLKSGDVAFIPAGPEYPHQIINTSDAPLKYLSISTRESPEVCEYPDSGKYLAMAGKPGVQTFGAIQRHSAKLDYWDGEP
jgi:uncharacterized cupin superfamily protein